jgi:hypothetical protein
MDFDAIMFLLERRRGWKERVGLFYYVILSALIKKKRKFSSYTVKRPYFDTLFSENSVFL